MKTSKASFEQAQRSGQTSKASFEQAKRSGPARKASFAKMQTKNSEAGMTIGQLAAAGRVNVETIR